ncbi:CDP-glycerol glycerophosphotransferase family protein [Candidatus Merdisoma sp. JLR.KK011]|uniref:CDP-glycerol glycerophosphotransferase family protein n=1 Tax=Candidatus Merdisoma sp. JLR.KK011 TaxID=3114299 RepID=UPI002FF00FA1
MNDFAFEKCRSAGAVYIYGAGTAANIFYLSLCQRNLQQKVEGFVVSRMNNNQADKYGVKVYEFSTVIRHMRHALVILAVQTAVKDEITSFLRKHGIRNVACPDMEELLEAFYKELWRLPVQKGKILFQNHGGLGYGGNPKYIAQSLIKQARTHGLDLVWAVTGGRSYYFPDEIRTVEIGSRAYYEELAAAHIWVDNIRKSFDARKREGQFYLQAWHGAAPGKRVEADIEELLPDSYAANAKRDSKMADAFLSGSEFYTQLYRTSFWYNGMILKYGLPRQDIFWNTDKAREQIADYYHLDKDAWIALYAPTFRDDFGNRCYGLDLAGVLEALSARFKKEFVILVSRHPSNRNMKYPFEGHADYVDVGDYEDFEELLAASDVLITDYSGCMYDFSFSQRPVFLYQPDLEEYKGTRNFYIPPQRLPYIQACSNEELAEKIRNFDEAAYRKKLELFMNSMGNYDDGHAADRTAEFLLDIVMNGP